MLVGSLELVLLIGGLLAVGDDDIVCTFYGIAWQLFHPVPHAPPWHAHRRVVDLREYENEEESEDESEDEEGKQKEQEPCAAWPSASAGVQESEDASIIAQTLSTTAFRLELVPNLLT